METIRKCAVCGKEKPISEFSKSYPKRCKECVAEHTRQVRAEAKQDTERAVPKDNRPFKKAIVKDTSETVLVRMCREPLSIRTAVYETTDGRKFPMFALEYEKEIDWEQRRYEIAKEMLCAIYLDEGSEKRNTGSGLLEYQSLNGCAKEAIRYADALIEELKKTSNNETSTSIQM